jgi:hypothetical protein
MVQLKNSMNTIQKIEIFENNIDYWFFDIIKTYKKELYLIILLTFCLYCMLFKRIILSNEDDFKSINMSLRNIIFDIENQNKIIKKENKEFINRNVLMEKMLSTTNEKHASLHENIMAEYELNMYDLKKEVKELKNINIDLSNEIYDLFMKKIELSEKVDKIREIFVAGEYNDPEYLIYDKWNITKLKKKAKELKITLFSSYRINSRLSLAYTIRLTEQRNRIEEIVEPLYPDGYETEEMVLKESYNDESESS